MADDGYVPLLFLPTDDLPLQRRLTDGLCHILFALGITGNVLGLLIFSSSRQTRRISSTYVCLATCSSIVNLLCVLRYASILHSISRQVLGNLIGHASWACKTYQISSSFRVISSWITLFWMFERLVCVSPRLKSLCRRWKSLKLKFIVPIVLIALILVAIIGPPLYMFQPNVLKTLTLG